MIGVAFGGALIVGGILVAISLWLIPRSEVLKSISDLFLKLSIVIFGVTVALTSFFGQKWLDDVDGRIEQANEALGNLDMIRAEYMTDVRYADFLIDPYFNDLRLGCKDEIEAADKEDHNGYNNYCTRDIRASHPPQGDNLLNAVEYFGYTPRDSLVPGFSAKIYDQKYIKRTINENIVEEMFKQYNTMLERYEVMKAEVDSIRKLSDERKQDLAVLGEARLQSASQSLSRKGKRGLREMPPTSKLDERVTKSENLGRFAHAVCCTVRTLVQESERIKAAASAQAKLFCDIKDGIRDSLETSLDPIVHFLARSRLDEIGKRIRDIKDAKLCEYARAVDTRD
jgi:hypothetical protein